MASEKLLKEIKRYVDIYSEISKIIELTNGELSYVDFYILASNIPKISIIKFRNHCRTLVGEGLMTTDIRLIEDWCRKYSHIFKFADADNVTVSEHLFTQSKYTYSGYTLTDTDKGNIKLIASIYNIPLSTLAIRELSLRVIECNNNNINFSSKYKPLKVS